MRTPHPLAALLLAACGPSLNGPATVAPAPEPIAMPAEGAVRYALSFPDAAEHLVDVEMTLAPSGDSTELMMPTWTPGSYLIREYARQIERLEVDPPATVAKTAKNRWTVHANGAEALRVRYRVYGREMGVQSNFVDADLGMLNGAATFLVPVDRMDQPLELAVALPEAWPKLATSLDPVEGAEHTWRARDFDELVDSPLVAGDLAIYDFEIQGVPHQLVNWGEQGLWDGEKASADVEKIVRTQTELWGTIPYDRYLFLNVISEGGGGLEHKRSTLMLTGRWRGRKDAYKGWLGLVSHEFFHTWNVKRLRPVELGPFDYEHEVLTENLWIAEGFTSYYDDLLLVRAGLLDEEAWLERMTGNIRSLQTTHGRLLHPLSQTSRDAWIKYYRKDENTKNTTVSYYTKGAVVAFLLDAEIRRNTAGSRTLDHVLRAAFEKYSGERGYTSEEFRAVVSDVAATDLGPWLARAVDGTDELDYTSALEWYGLRFAPPPEANEGKEATPWLGLSTNGDTVSRVDRDTPAYAAGFNVDDEVLAVNGFRTHDLGQTLASWKPGDEVEVLISRRGALRTLKPTLGEKPRDAWVLEPDPDANPAALERRKRLLAIE